MKIGVLLFAISGCASTVPPVESGESPPPRAADAGFGVVVTDPQLVEEPPVELQETTWAIAQGPVESVKVLQPCHSAADVFYLSTTRMGVDLYRSLPAPPSGVPHEPAHERGRGDWTDGVLRIDGEHVPRQSYLGSAPSSPVSYELRREEATGNLVGTRNGAPIRLAPARIEPAQQTPCGAPPP